MDQVVSVGTKSEVEYKVTPYKTIQKYDPNLPKGTTIVTGGENGSTKSITPYYLDEKTGYV
ncbi:G5 domain-containing protein [Lactobacillus delbrueckii subsp. allosunkii]